MYIKFPGGTSTVLTLRCRFAKNAGKERRGNYSTEIPMIRKYTFGNPYPTEAVVVKMEAETSPLPYFTLRTGSSATISSLTMDQCEMNSLKEEDFVSRGSKCWRFLPKDLPERPAASSRMAQRSITPARITVSPQITARYMPCA